MGSSFLIGNMPQRQALHMIFPYLVLNINWARHNYDYFYLLSDPDSISNAESLILRIQYY